jgi:hypothetical protein
VPDRWEVAPEVSYRFTAPTFITPETVQFRYRLEGYDMDWQESGRQRSATYSRQPLSRNIV